MPGSEAEPLLPELARPHDGEALAFGDVVLGYGELADAAAAVTARIAGAARVAVVATSTVETAIAVLGGLGAGAEVVPLNPASGTRELDHVVGDSRPEAVLAAAGTELGGSLAGIGLTPVAIGDMAPGPHRPPPEPSADAVAFVMYTSGTTGPPKGALLTRGAVAADLDALASVWDWTAADVLVHGLPLFHVHGLILGVLGPLRTGGRLHHVGHFSAGAIAAELETEATMLFGVPTMYHRLGLAAEADTAVAQALGRARVLVSGSAALPRVDHERILHATGRGVLERYGMTETLITCAVPAGGAGAPGTVGPPVPGVDLRISGDDGTPVDGPDAVGEIQVRGPCLYSGYLNRPDATAAAATADGWFRTGDVGSRRADGYVTILGRRATDLIKTGGFKIGAGEIEDALLDHPGVAEAAVVGVADPDLGERAEAWVVATTAGTVGAAELTEHVAGQLAPHKRPRVILFVERLPRNEMGKVLKGELRS